MHVANLFYANSLPIFIFQASVPKEYCYQFDSLALVRNRYSKELIK